MGNSYVLVALDEHKYVTFLGYGGEREILLNHFASKIALGFLRTYDMGYGGGTGEFAFIGDQWTPHAVFDQEGIIDINKIYNYYEDVTQEIIDDLIEDGILDLSELPQSSTPNTKEKT